LSFQRNLKAGLTFNVNYNWAHSLDNATPMSEQLAQGYGSVPSLVDTRDYGNSLLDIGNRIVGLASYELPFGKGATGARKLFTNGWHANVINVWSTGTAFTVVSAQNLSNTNPGASGAERPNQVGPWKMAHPGIGTGGYFFNPAAFASQAVGTLGNERINQLFGPHFRHLDLSAFKAFPVTERVNVEFRAECFNLTNTATFATPNATLGGSFFGQVTSTDTRYTPREFQFALKLRF
jgi:hypothetical protein